MRCQVVVALLVALSEHKNASKKGLGQQHQAAAAREMRARFQIV
jgi:hypothetical protein